MRSKQVCGGGTSSGAQRLVVAQPAERIAEASIKPRMAVAFEISNLGKGRRPDNQDRRGGQDDALVEQSASSPGKRGVLIPSPMRWQRHPTRRSPKIRQNPSKRNGRRSDISKEREARPAEDNAGVEPRTGAAGRRLAKFHGGIPDALQPPPFVQRSGRGTGDAYQQRLLPRRLAVAVLDAGPRTADYRRQHSGTHGAGL